jgi:hypothetical protein
MIVGVVHSGADSRHHQNGQFDVVAVPEIADIVARYIDTNFESIVEYSNNFTLKFFFAPYRDAVDAVADLSSGLQDHIQGISSSFPAQAGPSISVTRSERLLFAIFAAIRRASSTTYISGARGKRPLS